MTIYLARVERHVDTTRVEAFSRRIREDRAVFQGVIERTGAKVN
jgi:hypothetical protein